MDSCVYLRVSQKNKKINPLFNTKYSLVSGLEKHVAHEILCHPEPQTPEDLDCRTLGVSSSDYRMELSLKYFTKFAFSPPSFSTEKKTKMLLSEKQSILVGK